ncbi:hypothetical protein BV898_05486 [Hypsibius exemplaris]|nr:hypothetical protein BV898_05486 [Hypsibius exemplaris]
MEVTLTCQSKGTKYNLVQSVDVVQPDRQLADRLKLTRNEKIVVAAFAASESRGDQPKASCGLCLFTMPDVKDAFERNAQMCFSANRPNRGLGFIAGANLACPKVTYLN